MDRLGFDTIDYFQDHQRERKSSFPLSYSPRALVQDYCERDAALPMNYTNRIYCDRFHGTAVLVGFLGKRDADGLWVASDRGG